ncbi:nucleotidyltransferase family protein [Veillonella denticariosi JCM 15641]|uniref:Nucleotidyltransferase family protein n=1 Tax=Veillonella denticariosi JCM 15641 TaxID=1298594 RepID=A0A2S7ZCT7_9FIRM|nr:nucleotidyltransferase family protein [Veillonella denticariosi]PQL21093.1 nucleotidyltransferase family protein [Veillonella denticariosi JCM 15641]
MTAVKDDCVTAFKAVKESIDREPLHIGIVLLAGGQSKRMGCNKLLLPWRNKTVIDAVCEALRSGWDGVDILPLTDCKRPFVAITGDDHDKLAPIVSRYGFEAIQNTRPEQGQGVSIAMGVRHLLDLTPIPLDGILCSVGDQPLLTGPVVGQIIEAFEEYADPKTIVVPHYGAAYRSGNPVLFGSYWFSALQQIDGDQGGKTIIRGIGKDHVVKVWISDDIGVDIDTPDDFKHLQGRESETL